MTAPEVSVPVVATALSVVVWVVLLVFRGGFWRADQRLADDAAAATPPPGVVAVIPARNEAVTIGETVASLLAQDYAGRLSIIVVDDGSDDGTGETATEAAGDDARLVVIRGRPLEAGWTGKLWAVHQGLQAARDSDPDAEYVLLTDADIAHGPKSLARLVGKADAGGFTLVSLMALLRCRSFWERLLIPAFVFFFQKLYPFPWVNDPTRASAAAAGGCMLVRRRAFDAAGGIEAIRGELIDDCALAQLVKPHGPIWLGLTEDVRSLRAYDRLADVWRMVARTAYAQLNHSPTLLIVVVAAMGITYLVPPLAAVGLLGGDWTVRAAGIAAWWGLMAMAFWPTLRLYGQASAWALALPAAAALYTLMTVSSALAHWRGRGGAWKGRHYPRRPAPDR